MRRDAEKVIKEAGHCQACMRVQMVRKGKQGFLVMVQHGYKRPGTGWIEGGCMGVDEPPFEISKDLVVQIRDGLIRSVEDYTAFLDRLTTGKIREFMVDDVEQPLYSDQKDWQGKQKVIGYKKKWISIDSKDIREKLAAERRRDTIIRQASQVLKVTIMEVDERTKMIEQWKVRPILEWDAYEEEKKLKGAPKDVPAEVGALLLKMARKSKTTVPYDVLAAAVRELGWAATTVVHLTKLTRDYRGKDALSSTFKGLPGYEGIDGLAGVNDEGYVTFSSKHNAEEGLSLLRRKSVIVEGDLPKNPDPDRLFIRYLGEVMYHPGRWGGSEGSSFSFKVRHVWYPVPGFEIVAINGEKKSFASIRGNYRGQSLNDIVPPGFWTWAYRLGLNEQADQYVKEHASKPAIEGEADDEMGRLVQPRPVESFT